MAIVQTVVVNTKKAVASLGKLIERLNRVRRGGESAGRGLTRFRNIAIGAFGAIIAYRIGSHLFNQFRQASAGALEFGKALGEIETLIPAAERNTERLSNQLIRLSNQYGQSAQKQARGFYDIVSAGVQGFNKQLEVLNVTNKVAIGGVTDTATATNLLVTTMNAFESQGVTATKVADILFTTVKQGVTTIPQLASSLGQVNAIASTANVRLEEVGAAMAVLTKNGISTAQSATALKSSITAFSKPTAEAQRLVKKLGIEFSGASLEQKGFSQTLREIRKATNGNTTALRKLFPNVRAQAAILPLLTTRWKEFEQQLKNFEDTAGASDQAFERITRTASFQISRFNTIFTNLVTQFQTALDSDIADLFKEINKQLEGEGPYVFAAGLALVLATVQKTISAGRQFSFWLEGLEKSKAETQIARINSRIRELETGVTRGGKGFRVGFTYVEEGSKSAADEIKKLQGQLKSYQAQVESADAAQGKLADAAYKTDKSFEALIEKILDLPGKLKESAAAANQAGKAILQAGNDTAAGASKMREEPLSLIDTLTKAAGFTKGLGKVVIKDQDDRVKKQKESISEIGALSKSAFGDYKAFQIAEATIATYSRGQQSAGCVFAACQLHSCRRGNCRGYCQCSKNTRLWVSTRRRCTG